jgi:hypothetical protein
MEELIAKHSEDIKKLEDIIADLRKESNKKTELFDFVLASRDEKIKRLETKLAEKETKVTSTDGGNDRPLSESLELTTPLQIKLSDEANFSPKANSTINMTSMTNIADKWEGFQFVTEIIPSVEQSKVEDSIKSKEAKSKAKIYRMIKQVHDQMGKSSWKSKPALIDRNYKKSMGKQTSTGFFIICPECCKEISTKPTNKKKSENCGNFSVNHYKKHIVKEHC